MNYFNNYLIFCFRLCLNFRPSNVQNEKSDSECKQAKEINISIT